MTDPMSLQRAAHARRRAQQGPPIGAQLVEALSSFLAERGLESPIASMRRGLDAYNQGFENYFGIGAPHPAQLAGPVPAPPGPSPLDQLPQPPAPMGPNLGPPVMPSPDFGGITGGGSHALAPPLDFSGVMGGGSQALAQPPMPGAPPSFANVNAGSSSMSPGRPDFSNVIANALPPPPQAPPSMAGPGGPGAPPMSPPMPPPPPIGTPVMEQAGPVQEPPMINHAAAASMMGAFPPGSSMSPLAGERPIESYFSDSALQQRMQEETRNARIMALLAIGSGLLGGEDLASGLSAAGEGVMGQLGQLRQKEQELPLEYAGKRFDIEGERERRDLLRKEDVRQERGTSIAEQGAAQRAALHPGEVTKQSQEIAKGEHEIKRIPILDQLDQYKLEAERLGNVAAQKQIDRIGVEIERLQKLLPIEIAGGVQDVFESQARTGMYNRSTGSRGGSGFTDTRAGIVAGRAYEQAERDMGPDSPDVDATALYYMLQDAGNISEERLNSIDPDLGDASIAWRALQQGIPAEELLAQNPPARVAAFIRMMQLRSQKPAQ